MKYKKILAAAGLLGVGLAVGSAGVIGDKGAEMVAGRGMLALVRKTQADGSAQGKPAMPDDGLAQEKSDSTKRADHRSLIREKGREYPRVSLTFDDGPSRKYTPLLLEGLRERGIRATFFLMGKNIEGNEELVEQIQADGHLIGNHTYNHVQLNKIPEGKAREEIEKTSNEIYEVTGVYPSYIRPPFGAWRKNLDLSVTMFPVFWDIDTLDWKTRDPDRVIKIVEEEVHDGSIILMHDSFETSVDAALRVVDELSAKGYDFVTVDELLIS